MGLVATAMTARATGTTTARVTGIGIGTAIVEAAGTAGDSIAPTLSDLRRLTGAEWLDCARRSLQTVPGLLTQKLAELL
jgi:hypothetical protein